MKRFVTACAVGTLIVAAEPAVAAWADSPALNTSYAAAAKVTPGAGLAPQVTLGGTLGGLLDFLSPVLDEVVTPLSDAVTALPAAVVSDLVDGLTANGFSAEAAPTPQSPPAGGLPDCTSGGWTTDNCYGPVAPAVSAGPLVTMSSGSLQGYAAADSTGAYAAASSVSPALSLLGIDLGDLGLAGSTSQCLANGDCSSSTTLTDMTLLGGAVNVRTTNGAVQVSLDGGSFVDVSALGSALQVNGAGRAVTVQPQGGSVQVTVSLTFDELLTALGIADVLDSLNTTVDSSSVTLALTIGAGRTSTSTSSSAWGLDLGLGLSLDVNLSVLGLATVELAAGDTSTTGDLVDLQLAYTSAADADTSTANPSGAPPALT